MSDYSSADQVNDSSASDSDLTDAQSNGDSDDDILAQAREHYRLCVNADTQNRLDAVADLTFKLGGDNQWDERAVVARRNAGRPLITVNQLPTFTRQVTNDMRMNTPSIHVHPVGGNADEKTANIRQGVIRHIEYDSNADTAYDMAGTSAADIGWGFWYLDTEFESATSFDQKIVFRNVPNTLSVRIDPLSTEVDGSDMQYAFIEGLQNKADFKREYPNANANSPEWVGQDAYSMWIQEDTVLVCRYYCIKTEKATVVQLSNGETGWKDKLLELPPGVTIAREREGERKRVMCYKITGVDVLERTEIKMVEGGGTSGPWIPIFPVYGDRTFIEGRMYLNGIIRNAKGPCQSFNVMMSGATEEVANRSKAQWVVAEGQDEGYEDEYAFSNQNAIAAVHYNPKTIDGVIVQPPQRMPVADIPAGMLAMAMHARDNIKAVTGLYDSSLGAQGNATSGKQEIAQQRQGDLSNFHYADNRNKSVLHCGRVLNAMIPAYYDGERIVQIMRPDDTLEQVTINQQLPEPIQDPRTGAIQTVLNDMTGGEFSVTVSAGPSYATMRQENQEFFTSAMQAAKDPATNSVVTYLAMQNSDAPGAEIATKMLKTLLPPPAQAVLDEENNEDGEEGQQQQMVQTPRGPVPAAQIPQILAQLERQLQAASEAVQQAQADKQRADAAKAQEAVMKQQNEAEALQLEREKLVIAQYEAETARIQAQNAAEDAHATAIVNAEKNQIDRERAQVEMVRAAAENIRSQIEADTPADEAGEKRGVPTLEEIQRMIAEATSQQTPITGMQITAPSGGVYQVKMQ